MGEWALYAYDILADIAGRYGRTISPEDLGAEAQRRSDIHTSLPGEAWLPRVIDQVASRCRDSGGPQLTSLLTGTDADAEARTACYRAYGAKIPAERSSAGRATRRTSSSGAATKTAKVKRPSKVPPTHAMCPTCFLELPSTGVCDNCS